MEMVDFLFMETWVWWKPKTCNKDNAECITHCVHENTSPGHFYSNYRYRAIGQGGTHWRTHFLCLLFFVFSWTQLFYVTQAMFLNPGCALCGKCVHYFMQGFANAHKLNFSKWSSSSPFTYILFSQMGFLWVLNEYLTCSLPVLQSFSNSL